MSTALGVIGLLAFAAGVVLLAAAITWLVVRLSPAPGAKKQKAAS